MSGPRVKVVGEHVWSLGALERLITVARDKGMTVDAVVNVALSPQTITVSQFAEDIEAAADVAEAEQ